MRVAAGLEETGSLQNDVTARSCRWRAVVPLKRRSDRKTRLSKVLSQPERARLSDAMACHVLEQLRRSCDIESILVLAPEEVAWPGIQWTRDHGHGLNAELDALLAATGPPLLVIHADLPFLRTADVDLMLAQARARGSAIAPDRYGSGTNALALLSPSGAFGFRFGPGSCALHIAQLADAVAIVRQPGLALDIDTARDLADARRYGLPM